MRGLKVSLLAGLLMAGIAEAQDKEEITVQTMPPSVAPNHCTHFVPRWECWNMTMPGIDFFILLFVSLSFIACGATSALAPKAAIKWDRRVCHKLRLICKDKLKMPIKRRRIIFERVQGAHSSVLGYSSSVISVPCSY